MVHSSATSKYLITLRLDGTTRKDQKRKNKRQTALSLSPRTRLRPFNLDKRPRKEFRLPLHTLLHRNKNTTASKAQRKKKRKRNNSVHVFIWIWALGWWHGKQASLSQIRRDQHNFRASLTICRLKWNWPCSQFDRISQRRTTIHSISNQYCARLLNQQLLGDCCYKL